MIYLILIIVAEPGFGFDFGFVVMYALRLRLRLRGYVYEYLVKNVSARLKSMRLSDMIGIIKLVILVFLKSPPLYIYRAHSCRWRHFFADIPISPHLAMLIRVIGSDRAVNTIWHRKARLKPVRSYNVTIVIRFGCLSSFQNCLNISMSSKSVSLSSFVCRYMSPFRRTQPC